RLIDNEGHDQQRFLHVESRRMTLEQRGAPASACRARKPSTALLNASLRSPATMWSAPAMLSNSACGTKPRNAVTLSSLTTRLMLPRTSKVGRRRSEEHTSE